MWLDSCRAEGRLKDTFPPSLPLPTLQKRLDLDCGYISKHSADEEKLCFLQRGTYSRVYLSLFRGLIKVHDTDDEYESLGMIQAGYLLC